jgi:hypothetical protein
MKIKRLLLLGAACGYGTAVAQQPTSQPIGELFAADGNAKLVQPTAAAGMSVVAGSELSAGVAPARLKLYRGGQLRICPQTNLTVNSGRYGLMFGIGSGMLEFDYTLVQRGADLLLTPDFSIQLSGPGRYHFALGSNKQGDTCVKSLAGNSSPLQVTELMGSATYRVRAQDSVAFHAGKIEGSVPLKTEEACGCPESPTTVRVENEAPQTNPPQPVAAQPPALPVPARNTTEPVPEDRPGQIHVQVDTPFVFSGKDASSLKPYSVAKLSISSLPNVFFVQDTVEPIVQQEQPAVVSVREEAPAPVAAPSPEKAAQKREKKGFLGKLKGLFGGLFGR